MFELNLNILARNVNMYELACEDCDKRGTVLKYKESTYKNPSYEIMRDCEKRINDISKQFGLDTYNKTKINKLKSTNKIDIDPSKLLDDLMA